MSNDKMREAFEEKCPVPDGIFWCDDLGYYTTKDESLVPDMDRHNEIFDVWEAALAYKIETQYECGCGDIYPELSVSGQMIAQGGQCENCDAFTQQPESEPELPNEHGTNRYGLDMAYFRNLINRDLNSHSLDNYKPSELARVFARMAAAADRDVLRESEFSGPQPTPQVPEGWREAMTDLVRGKGCNFDTLNPCYIGRPDDVVGRHWGGGRACEVCTAKGLLAAPFIAEERGPAIGGDCELCDGCGDDTGLGTQCPDCGGSGCRPAPPAGGE